MNPDMTALRAARGTPAAGRRRARRWTVAATVCAALTVPAAAGSGPLDAAAATGVPVQVTYTSADGSRQLSDGQVALNPLTDTSADVSVAVDPSSTRQTMLGFGGSLESSSVHNIVNLSPWNRHAVMNLMFNREGNRYNLMRLAFGCSDFCATPKDTYYTYHDDVSACAPGGPEDVALPRFSIQRDVDAGIVSVAREALAINPDLKFFASVWSPPAWMKTNNSLKNGGEVRRECYGTLAAYYRLAIQAYEARGIPIHAVTAQNEPTVVTNYPSTSWTWSQQRDFVRVLGAHLRAHGLDTEIWVQDDNLLRTQEFAGQILADPSAAEYVDGVGYHDYEGDLAYTGDMTQPAQIAARFPGVTQHITERSYYGINGAARLVEAFRNDVSSYSYWLTLLDTAGEPNAGPLNGAVHPQQFGAEHGNLDNWWVDDDYYLYGQFSRYMERGAVRVDSSSARADVSNVAFRNPDGTLVVVVVNRAEQPRSLRLVSPGGQITDQLPPRSVATYRWSDPAGSLQRPSGATASASSSHPAQPAHLAVDGRLDTRWSSGRAQAPGQSFTLDLGRTQSLRRLALFIVPVDDPGGSRDHPRQFSVQLSSDGRTWSAAVATGAGTPDVTTIDLGTVRQARYVRVNQTGTADNWWSVSEVVVGSS